MPILKKTTKRLLRAYFILLVTILASHGVNAKEIFVNNVTGSDANSGLTAALPVKTILQSIRLVRAGDIIHFANTGVPYKESLPLGRIVGTEAAPILIDGHGATLSGSDPINLANYHMVAPGLYRDTVCYTANRFVPDVLRVYFFLFNDTINRMGRSRKGPNAAFKLPSALNEKEWTFVESEKAFYLKINPAKTLAEYNIQQPIRGNGIGVVGNTQYVTVKNLIIKNVYNDGVGLTSDVSGNPKKMLLKNIQCWYCGDDGISAHEGSEVDVEEFVSIGNATGICNGGISKTSFNRVFIRDCVGVDIFLMNEKTAGESIQTIKNAVVLGNGYWPVALTATQPGAKVIVRMENVLIKPATVPDPLRHNEVNLVSNSYLYAKDCTFAGLTLSGNAQPICWENTIIDGRPLPPATGASIENMLEPGNPMNPWFQSVQLIVMKR